jgi:hypothetical protein
LMVTDWSQPVATMVAVIYCVSFPPFLIPWCHQTLDVPLPLPTPHPSPVHLPLNPYLLLIKPSPTLIKPSLSASLNPHLSSSNTLTLAATVHQPLSLALTLNPCSNTLWTPLNPCSNTLWILLNPCSNTLCTPFNP